MCAPFEQEELAGVSTSNVSLQQQQQQVAAMLGLQAGCDSEEARMLANMVSSLAGRPELVARAKALLEGLQVEHDAAAAPSASTSTAAVAASGVGESLSGA
jgi:hypothetical protein